MMRRNPRSNFTLVSLLFKAVVTRQSRHVVDRGAQRHVEYCARCGACVNEMPGFRGGRCAAGNPPSPRKSDQCRNKNRLKSPRCATARAFKVVLEDQAFEVSW